MEKHNLHFTQEAWLKIQAAVHYDPKNEISFFGHMVRNEDGPDGQSMHTVDDIIIPPQEAGGAHVDFDVAKGDLDWLLSTIIARGQQPSEYRFWGHSHNTMGTTPSGQDHSTLGMLATKAWPIAGYGVGAVFNTRQEVTAWFATKTAFGSSSYAEGDIKGVTYDPVLNPYTDEIEAVCKDNVHQPVPTPTAISTSTGTGGGNKDRRSDPSYKDWLNRGGTQQAPLFSRDELAEALVMYKNAKATPSELQASYEEWKRTGIRQFDVEDVANVWIAFNLRRAAMANGAGTAAEREALQSEETEFAFDLWNETNYTLRFLEQNTKLIICPDCGAYNLWEEVQCVSCIADLSGVLA